MRPGRDRAGGGEATRPVAGLYVPPLSLLYLVLSPARGAALARAAAAHRARGRIGRLAVEVGAPIDFDQRGERRLFVDVLSGSPTGAS